MQYKLCVVKLGVRYKKSKLSIEPIRIFNIYKGQKELKYSINNVCPIHFGHHIQTETPMYYSTLKEVRVHV